MSRSGYSDDCENWDLIRWRGAVAAAVRGRRGQAFLRELLAALDALESQRLIAGDLVCEGEVCALGAVGVRRGLALEDIDPDDREGVAATFGIATALAAEIADVNDEGSVRWVPPERRWEIVRAWVVNNLREEGNP